MPRPVWEPTPEAVAAAVFGDQPPTFADARITVYTVTPPAQPQSYLELGPLNWGPLVVTDDRRYRTVGSDPAEVWVRHEEGSRTVHLTYRGLHGGEVVAADGTVTPLPAADGPTMVAVRLAAGIDHFRLAGAGGELQVERIELAP